MKHEIDINNGMNLVNNPSVENEKSIEIHKRAAYHFMQAAKYHLQAINHHENNQNEKAAFSSLLAHGHQSNGCKAQIEYDFHHSNKH